MLSDHNHKQPDVRISATLEKAGHVLHVSIKKLIDDLADGASKFSHDNPCMQNANVILNKFVMNILPTYGVMPAEINAIVLYARQTLSAKAAKTA